MRLKRCVLRDNNADFVRYFRSPLLLTLRSGIAYFFILGLHIVISLPFLAKILLSPIIISSNPFIWSTTFLTFVYTINSLIF